MEENDIEHFCPANQQHWREWLEENHLTKDSVWVVFHKKSTGRATVFWGEAVDQALCFGWIDSTKKTIDSDTYKQFFTKRKPKSGWSKINKLKVDVLIAEGMMAPKGLESIAVAKENGSWTIIDEVEELTIPEDLTSAFDEKPGSLDFFNSLSKSARKQILHWLVFAKREETRQKRIAEIVESAAIAQKPLPFRGQ